jgi:hypothetical protein
MKRIQQTISPGRRKAQFEALKLFRDSNESLRALGTSAREISKNFIDAQSGYVPLLDEEDLA